MSLQTSSRTKLRTRRTGSIVLLAAFMLVVMLGIMAFAVDLGYMQVVRTEAQRCADAAALAGAWEMASEARLRGDDATAFDQARQKAAQFAALNKSGVVNPVLSLNHYNADLQGDIILGRLDDPRDQTTAMSFADTSQFNTVSVRIRCTSDRGQQAPLFFARIFGFEDFGVTAEATATFDDNVCGFRVTDNTPNASLIPFAIDADDWDMLVAGVQGTDNFGIDSEGEVVSGSDGIPELKIFPGSTSQNGKHVTPGNWGAVDIGNTNNSTADLRRQIQEGVSAGDLVPYDGTLSLDPHTGTLTLNGDTGISAGIKDALGDVVGQGRTALLYTEVTGQGNNTWYTINGFAGIRIVSYSLTGNDKYILVQPAYVFDPTAVTAPGADSSYFVGQPVHLTR